MIAEFTFPYDSLIRWNYQPKEGQLEYELLIPKSDYLALRALLPELPELKDDHPTGIVHGKYIANIHTVCKIFPKIEINKVFPDGSVDVFDRLIEKMDRISERIEKNTYNEKCNVHVPGLGLLMIEELKLCEDACTETIREQLMDRWRIIAVCPQPDQRRPDYILGRSK